MKRTIFALVIGMLIGSAATAFAASDTVTATIAKLRFVVNGEERDVQTEQLVVYGTTYLPVREVANMLGYDVVYRSDSKTVEFNTANDSTKKGDRQDMDHTIDEIKPNQPLSISFTELESAYGIEIEYSVNESGWEVVTLRKGEKELTFLVTDESNATVMIKGGYTIVSIDGELYTSEQTVEYLTAA